ncbi:MAG: histidinol-phosphate transaminase [Dehalococcoidia bacterium]|nr:histidinol-phosphate transaminase [Dehalococcoidia bacterium]
MRASLRSLTGYVPIEPPEEVAARYGVAPADIVKLDGNENPYGPSPRAVAALAAPYAAHRYPDPDQRRLRAALATHLGVPVANVVAGAGSDELIDLIFRAYVEAGDRIVVSTPTFGMYAFDAELHDAAVVDVPRLGDVDGWALDGDALVQAASDAKVVFLPTPNNPTGDVLPRGLVDRLLDSGALLVVDEAYIEFSHADSLAREAADGAPLVVLRTFSKWAGLAGLRVGYGVMPASMAALAMQIKQPYDLNVAAEVAALASLEDRALLDERACTITGERDALAKALAATGWVHPYPSEANFILCRLDVAPGRHVLGVDVRERLRRRGVFIRYFDTPRLRDHIRISIGTAEDSARLLTVLAEVRAELSNSTTGKADS